MASGIEQVQWSGLGTSGAHLLARCPHQRQGPVLSLSAEVDLGACAQQAVGSVWSLEPTYKWKERINPAPKAVLRPPCEH